VVEQNRKHAALFKSARSICNSDAEDEAAPGGMVLGSNSKEEEWSESKEEDSDA